ncbi:hypothetical protein [Flavobacterium sp.]|uniref:hypothetical protein n=1 Tax=Flavobacterium sp. TaxID=239 RepID=UPI0022C79F4F|nr:hypothetical protein [Flavobacterium sp.]MCZ8367794.1 hypothetical protein [Flavobacterium sp.]
MEKKIFFLLLFSVSNFFAQSQEVDTRKNYINEVNSQTFLSLGNNDIMYYECKNECFDVEIFISEKYWRGIKTSKKQKQELGKTLIEQYTYLFYSKGFKTITVNIEGIEPITKELKLNR